MRQRRVVGSKNAEATRCTKVVDASQTKDRPLIPTRKTDSTIRESVWVAGAEKPTVPGGLVAVSRFRRDGHGPGSSGVRRWRRSSVLTACRSRAVPEESRRRDSVADCGVSYKLSPYLGQSFHGDTRREILLGSYWRGHNLWLHLSRRPGREINAQGAPASSRSWAKSTFSRLAS